MNKRACLRVAAEKKRRAASRGGETLPGDSCQQQRGAGFSLSRESGRKAGKWPSICTASWGLLTKRSSDCKAPLSRLAESINELPPGLLGPPANPHIRAWLNRINELEFRSFLCKLQTWESFPLLPWWPGLRRLPEKQAFRKIMCKCLSKLTENNCYAISGALIQHALTAGITRKPHTFWWEQAHFCNF